MSKPKCFLWKTDNRLKETELKCSKSKYILGTSIWCKSDRYFPDWKQHTIFGKTYNFACRTVTQQNWKEKHGMTPSGRWTVRPSAVQPCRFEVHNRVPPSFFLCYKTLRAAWCRRQCNCQFKPPKLGERLPGGGNVRPSLTSHWLEINLYCVKSPRLRAIPRTAA